MTSMNGQALPPTIPAQVARARERSILGVTVPAAPPVGRRVHLLPVAASLVGLVVGGAALFTNDADVLVPFAAGAIALAVALAVLDRARRTGEWDRNGLILAGSSAAVALVMLLWPEYLYGFQLNGVIHRSALSSVLLLVIGALTASHALRRLLGDTPSAGDVAVYPIVLVPVLLALVAYGLLVGYVIVNGARGLSLDILVNPWGEQIVGELGAGGTFEYTIGLRNHILGTLLLMAMTCLISLGPGVAVGIFVSEYPGRLAGAIGFSTSMLRAMSVFIIGVAAVRVVGLAGGLDAGDPLSRLIRGSFQYGETAATLPGSGSFLTAALFLSLLVIPIIAKLTEEGLRSVPRDIREGSIASGATEGYGLRRVLLPWAAPNIVTGLLLGAAEAAGSLAIILFLAGNGDQGIGPLNTVTGLDFALFATRYGTAGFLQTMGYLAPVDYSFTAALLLLVITLGLTVVAMLVRRRFAQRYRGSLTVG